MYSLVKMELGREKFRSREYQNELEFTMQAYPTLEAIPANNFTYTEENLWEVHYENWYDQYSMKTVMVVPEGQEQEAVKQLKEHARKKIQKMSKNLDELVGLLKK